MSQNLKDKQETTIQKDWKLGRLEYDSVSVTLILWNPRMHLLAMRKVDILRIVISLNP